MLKTGYLAADGFETELEREIGSVSERFGRLLISNGAEKPAAWAQNVWRDPVIFKIESIGDGAKQLRAIQRNWAMYDYQLHRRAKLIQEKLPHVSAKPVVFPSERPTAPLGSWTLIDENHILASADCSSPYKNGMIEFVEDKVEPPSRAYLKLWDAFTVTGNLPKAGETCLDLGACPGGWTWVLAKLGCNVISIDKAPLDPRVARMSGVSYRQESAFGLDPQSISQVDWLFSDIICYPSRLLTLVQKWIDTGLVRNFCCTIKFQGETDYETAAAFAAIPGSTLRHLSHNKHELTWMKIGE
jgi:23S rRNA (cytidine2498-2'-O)-methyltransferase